MAKKKSDIEIEDGVNAEGLISMIRENTKEFGETSIPFYFHTDNPLFDFMNATKYKDENGNFVVKRGIPAGKSIILCGDNGTGKSTDAFKLIYSVAKKYESSQVIYYDFEGGADKDGIRAANLGVPQAWWKKHVAYKDKKINANMLYNLVKAIEEYKLSNEKLFTEPNKEGELDKDGNPVMIMTPTFIFIDSIAGMNRKRDPKEEKELEGDTEAMRYAKFYKVLFREMVQPCLNANIIPVWIQHVTANVGMAGGAPKAISRFMNNTKAMAGGKGIQYFANLWLEVEANEKLTDNPEVGPEKGNLYGNVAGFKQTLKIIKSRNGRGGRSCSLVFSQDYGYDITLSLYEYLRDNKVITVGGAWYQMPSSTGEPHKFQGGGRKIKEILKTDDAFRKDFYRLVKETLEASLYDIPEDDDNASEAIDFDDDTNIETLEEANDGFATDNGEVKEHVEEVDSVSELEELGL